MIINSGKDTGVVIISIQENNALKSTQYELSSRINQQYLDAYIEHLKKCKKVYKNPEE